MSGVDVRLECLYEADESGLVQLPEELVAAYGGALRLPEETVYGNFVTSIDGVAALAGVERSSATISGGAPADRFVMALLRCAADAIVVGAGTLREHGGPWTAERAFPAGAHAFRRAREATRAEAPTLVVLSMSGDLPTNHRALQDAVVITTASGARTISDRRVRCARVLDLGDDVDPREAIGRLHELGHRRILTEGGPRLMGSMLEAAVVEQLFLTISPKLLGGGPEHPPLSDGADLTKAGLGGRLLGVRRGGELLFLRYRLIAR